MKKILIIALLSIGISSAFAQDSFKPADGAKNIELQFAPLGGSPISISGLRLRMFNGNSAIRANIFVGYNKKSTIASAKGDTGKTDLTTSNSSFEIGIRPGYEIHMAGTKNLSPYVGAEIDFGMKSSTDAVNRRHYRDQACHHHHYHQRQRWLYAYWPEPYSRF